MNAISKTCVFGWNASRFLSKISMIAFTVRCTIRITHWLNDQITGSTDPARCTLAEQPSPAICAFAKVVEAKIASAQAVARDRSADVDTQR